MDPLHVIADRKIQEALERGEFERLPGAGRPLELDDLSRVPEELRGAYMVLKGSGFLPEELELKRELLRLEDLIAACHDEGARAKLVGARTSAALRYALLLEKRGFGPAHQEYGERLAEKLARHPADAPRRDER
ncbi:MAG: DUF1992 domain-containing protein [Planctomycetes bacterium]|nr:DUF1992 domain-containing protein [Planctomycetota bacterium]